VQNMDVYADIIFRFLKDNNKKFFRTRELTENMSLSRGQIVAGLKALKRRGKIRKVSNRYWLCLDT